MFSEPTDKYFELIVHKGVGFFKFQLLGIINKSPRQSNQENKLLSFLMVM